MSTILDALRKLERDKHVDEAHGRPPDPLAPAPEPEFVPPAPRRRRMGWMAAGVALTFVIGLVIGISTLSSVGEDASLEVARGPAVAAPARQAAPRASRPAPIAGVERTASVRSPVHAAPPARRPHLDSKPRPMRTASAAEAASLPGPSSGARSVAPAPDPWEPTPAAPASDPIKETTETRTPAPVAAAPPNATDGVPIASLPEIELSPEPVAPVASTPVPTPVAPPPAVSRSRPTESAASKTESGAAPSSAEPARPALADVVVSDPNDRLEVKVLKTVWHPKPDRRSAQIQIADQGEAIEVRESQMVEGYRVESITPSTVVLSKGGVSISHRVGR